MAEKIGVFVSHHHSPKEDAFTARLVADLDAAGADVWVDYQGISSGSFVQKINEGMAGRQWLVLVLTPESLSSKWVQDEVNAALHQVNGGRMRGVIPFVMTRCDEAQIPPLWAQLHRYDATTGYEAARDGLLRAMGLSLPAAIDAPRSQAKVRLNKRDLDIALLKTLDGLLSLAPREFEDVVALMLTANGYKGVKRMKVGQVADFVCIAPGGNRTYVWCRTFPPTYLGHLVGKFDVSLALATVSKVDQSSLAMVVTTSEYTSEALTYAEKYGDRIQLIGGQQLVTMMQRVQPQ